MPRKKHSPEQILGKPREVEVALAQGETVARAVRQIGVIEQTYYRWRNEYGGFRSTRRGSSRNSNRRTQDSSELLPTSRWTS